MAWTPDEQVRRTLHVLADLSPSGEDRPAGLTIPTEWFRWLPVSSAWVLAPRARTLGGGAADMDPYVVPGVQPRSAPRAIPIDRDFAARLAAVDQLRPTERSLRIGWLFLAGRIRRPDGGYRRVFHPLVTRPVRVGFRATQGDAALLCVGDPEVTDLVKDPERRAELDQQVEWGGGAFDATHTPEIDRALLRRLHNLHTFARATAEATGFAASDLIPATAGPDSYQQRDGMVVVAGLAVYAVHDTDLGSRAGSLRAWATGQLPSWTAFHSLYADAPPPPHRPPAPTPVADLPSPFVLAPAQRQAVLHARTDDITVVSGAPGTGKSHTIAAIACDALAHGRSVLVAAKSDATVDALLDLFERAPGPDPVVFGSDDRRDALAARLADGQLVVASTAEVAHTHQACRDAVEAYRRQAGAIRDALATEDEVGSGPGGANLGRLVAPDLFGPNAPLAEATALLARARPARSGAPIRGSAMPPAASTIGRSSSHCASAGS